MSEFYDTDLAYVHHVGFDDFARQAGEEILLILHEHDIGHGLVVDLGCGSGIWARRLLHAGYDVQGVDVSTEMLALARSNAPGAHFHQSSIYQFNFPRCQVITALGEVLGYGSEGMPTDRQVAELFQRAADSLPPGGLFIFDVIVTSETESLDYRTWRKDSDWAVLVESKEDLETSRLSRGITIFREVGGSYRRSEEQHVVRVFGIDELQQLLYAAGFKVAVADCYGDYELAARRRSFMAVRK